MNSNWKTPTSARRFFCHMNDGPCISNACSYWLWRPCDAKSATAPATMVQVWGGAD